MKLHETLFRMLAAAALTLAVATHAAPAAALDTDAYARVLDRFVTADGGVRYAALEADSADLDRTLASPAGLVVERGGRKVAVSEIFTWFEDDFDAAGGVRAFLARYAPQEARAALADPDTRITYLNYDWSLNEAQGE